MSISAKLGKTALNLTITNPKDGPNPIIEAFKLTVEITILLFRAIWLISEALFRMVYPAPLKSVKGEIVLITGSGHGIGKELAFQYAAKGAVVVCWDINAKGNQETMEHIIKLGYPKPFGYVCNVANRNQVLETAKRVQKDVGDVTILVNNAGIMPVHHFLDYPTEEIERVMNINVMAHFWTLQAFLPAMIKNNHGHIVTISSCLGLFGIRNLVPYCASKFAVKGMTEALLMELRTDPKCSIKLTTIYPYGVNTGLAKKPIIRFPKLMGFLSPAYVAKTIVKAQRRNVEEASVPPVLLLANHLGRLVPSKVFGLVMDFVDSYPETDL